MLYSWGFVASTMDTVGWSSNSAYGSEVGSAAIKWIPTGGLYVTGGLTPKNIAHIEGKDSCFMKAFVDKGRVSPLLSTIPLFAVMEEDLGVRGALKCCILEYEKLHEGTKAAPEPEASGTGGSRDTVGCIGTKKVSLGMAAASAVGAAVATALVMTMRKK